MDKEEAKRIIYAVTANYWLGQDYLQERFGRYSKAMESLGSVAHTVDDAARILPRL